jgi:hypothetical protein
MQNIVPLESVIENFIVNFPAITVPSITGIHKPTKKVRSTGSLLYKKPFKKYHVIIHNTETAETLYTRDQYLKIISS